MPDLPRTRIGSFSVSRSLRSAVLIAGWVWFRRSAVCVTLRSTSSVRSTRTSQISREVAVSSMDQVRGSDSGGALFGAPTRAAREGGREFYTLRLVWRAPAIAGAVWPESHAGQGHARAAWP